MSDNNETTHEGKASSFADPADVKAFKKWYKIYLDEGLSPDRAKQRAFAKGDNGEGCWGDDTSEGSGMSCALPPEDMEEKFGSVAVAKHQQVEVTANDKTITCTLKDRMPHRTNITNGAMIDLNPDAVRALGLEPPIMVNATWRWLE